MKSRYTLTIEPLIGVGSGIEITDFNQIYEDLWQDELPVRVWIYCFRDLGICGPVADAVLRLDEVRQWIKKEGHAFIEDPARDGLPFGRLDKYGRARHELRFLTKKEEREQYE